jgi:hypothetical protein
MNSEFIIYALVDPREPSEFRYIGATSNPTKDRLAQHIWTATSRMKYVRITKVQRWIRKIRKAGLKPIILTLQECNAEQVVAAEQEWISTYSKTKKLKNCLKWKHPYPICDILPFINAMRNLETKP